MIVNVLELLRPLRNAEAERTEGALGALAARISRGENLSPQEISAALERIKASPEGLQVEIDRRGRLDDLRETIKTGKAAKRRLDTINAELDKARRVVEEAQTKSDDLAAKHEVEWRAMSDAVRAANEAAVTLTKPEYLTPEQRGILAALERKSHEAATAIADAKRAIPMIKDLIETADRDLAQMAAEGAPQGRIDSARRTVDARRERLRAAEETVGTRQREIDDATKQRDAIYEEIRRAVGA